MSDVLHAALEYHAMLQAELTKVENFLRVADDLSKRQAPAAQSAAVAKTETVAKTEPVAKIEPAPVPAPGQAARPDLTDREPASPVPAAEPQRRTSLFRGAFAAPVAPLGVGKHAA